MIYQDDAFSLDVRQGVVDEMKNTGHDGGDRRSHAEGLERHHRLPNQGEGDQARRADRLRPRERRGDCGASDGRLQIQVPIVGVTHCESAKVTQDFPKVSEGFVCPTQWDETMKASDPLFGTAANYNTRDQGGLWLQGRALSGGAGSAAVYVWADAFKRAKSLDKEKLREASDQDRHRDLLRPHQICCRRQQSGQGQSSCARFSTANTRWSGRQDDRRLQADLSARGSVLSNKSGSGRM